MADQERPVIDFSQDQQAAAKKRETETGVVAETEADEIVPEEQIVEETKQGIAAEAQAGVAAGRELATHTSGRIETAGLDEPVRLRYQEQTAGAAAELADDVAAAKTQAEQELEAAARAVARLEELAGSSAGEKKAQYEQALAEARQDYQELKAGQESGQERSEAQEESEGELRQKVDGLRQELEALKARQELGGSKAEKKALEKELREVMTRYEDARSEFIGAKVDRKLLDEIGAVEDQLRETADKKGLTKLLGKIPDAFRWLGDQSLLKLAEKKFGFKPTTRTGRVGAAVLKAMNLRTGIGLALFGATFTTMGAAVGAAGLRRWFGGGAAAVGTYDFMRQLGRGGLEKKAFENPAAMDDKELRDTMLKLAARDKLDGKDPFKNEAYGKLRAEYMYRRLSDSMKEGDKVTTERLQEATRGQKYRRLGAMAAAGGLGYMIGSGKMAELMRGAYGKVAGLFDSKPHAIVGISGEFEGKVPNKMVLETGGATAAKLEAVHEVQKGDNVWKIAKNALREKMGADKFDALPRHQQSFLIDSVKDRVAAEPGKYFSDVAGHKATLGNIDKIYPGQKLDIGAALEDATRGKGDLLAAAEKVKMIPRAHDVVGGPRGVPDKDLLALADKAAGPPKDLLESLGGKPVPAEGIQIDPSHKMTFRTGWDPSDLTKRAIRGVDFHGAKGSFAEAQKSLATGFEQVDEALKDQSFRTRITNLDMMKKALGTMERGGMGQTPEADFLRDQIKGEMGSIRGKYGEVFTTKGLKVGGAAAEAGQAKAEAAAAAKTEAAAEKAGRAAGEVRDLPGGGKEVAISDKVKIKVAFKDGAPSVVLDARTPNIGAKASEALWGDDWRAAARAQGLDTAAFETDANQIHYMQEAAKTLDKSGDRTAAKALRTMAKGMSDEIKRLLKG